MTGRKKRHYKGWDAELCSRDHANWKNLDISNNREKEDSPKCKEKNFEIQFTFGKTLGRKKRLGLEPNLANDEARGDKRRNPKGTVFSVGVGSETSLNTAVG